MDDFHRRLAEIGLDALVTSGAFTREELLALAAARDAGFDRGVFAQMLTVLDIYPMPNSPPTALPPPK